MSVSVVLSDSEAKLLLAQEHEDHKGWQSIARKIRKAQREAQPARKEPEAQCLHPVGRRIGDHCAACGALVKGAKK